MQQQSETVAVDVSGKNKKISNGSSVGNGSTHKDSLMQAAKKFQPRDQMSDEDSDTDVVSSDEDQEARNSYSSLERFLTAYDLEEYYPMLVPVDLTIFLLNQLITSFIFLVFKSKRSTWTR